MTGTVIQLKLPDARAKQHERDADRDEAVEAVHEAFLSLALDRIAAAPRAML